MSASSLRWPLLALLGLLVAGAIAFLATRAVSTDIGISSESPTAGLALSPTAPKSRPPSSKTTSATLPRTTTVTVPSRPGSGDGESGDD